MAMDHKIKTLESNKQDGISLLWNLPGECTVLGRGEGKKGGGTGVDYWQEAFGSLLTLSITVLMGVQTVTMVGLTPVFRIACLDDKASLTLATWEPSDQSFYWAASLRAIEKCGFTVPTKNKGLYKKWGPCAGLQKSLNPSNWIKFFHQIAIR